MVDTCKNAEEREQHTVFSFPGVALDHLVSGLEAGEGHVSDRVLLVVSLCSGDDGGESGEREVDTGEGDQVGLELVQVDVQGTVKSEGGGDGRDDLGNQTVEVGKAGGGDPQVLLANVIDGLVIDHERTIRVLEGGMGRQYGIVWLDDGVSEPGGGINAELELGLLSIIGRKTLEQESTEAGTGSTTERVEDEEALETRTVIGQAPDLVHNWVDLFFSYGVVTTGVYGSGIWVKRHQNATRTTYSCWQRPPCQ